MNRLSPLANGTAPNRRCSGYGFQAVFRSVLSCIASSSEIRTAYDFTFLEENTLADVGTKVPCLLFQFAFLLEHNGVCLLRRRFFPYREIPNS
jgi:hypothetical protein